MKDVTTTNKNLLISVTMKILKEIMPLKGLDTGPGGEEPRLGDLLLMLESKDQQKDQERPVSCLREQV